MRNTALILHGGCGGSDLIGPLVEERQRLQKRDLHRAIKLGWEMLSKGADAVSVVEAVVNVMEDSSAFNAGIGAAIGFDGRVELDASIMDGTKHLSGAVACIKGIPRPVSVARKVLEDSPHRLLVGEGANLFAKTYNFKVLPDRAFYTPYQELKRKKYLENPLHRPEKRTGTVGAVALDISGTIAAGTSTGGITAKMQGRVGDSPIIGAGTYADSRYGGASATGVGEQIIEVALTKSAIDLISLKKYSASQAAKESIEELVRVKEGTGGIIVIDSKGNLGWSTSAPYLSLAHVSSSYKEPVVEFAQ